MFWLLETLYKFFGNFGVAIIAITLIVKGLFFPLANRSYLSMARMNVPIFNRSAIHFNVIVES